MGNKEGTMMTTVTYLTDRQIACLYSQWSEGVYCAGWMSGGEEEFVKWLVSQDNRSLPLQDYELETVTKIRKLMEEVP